VRRGRARAGLVGPGSLWVRVLRPADARWRWRWRWRRSAYEGGSGIRMGGPRRSRTAHGQWNG